MWGSIISAGLGLGTSIYGNIKAGKEAKKRKNMLKKKEQEIDSYYTGELAENSLDTEYAKAAMKKIREQLDERRKRSDSTAAITGASDESRVAEKANDSKAISSAVTSLAQYGEQRKDTLRREYMDRKDSLFAEKMGIYQDNQQSAMNLSNNGWNTIGTAINAYYGTKNDKKANGEKDNADSGSSDISKDNKSGSGGDYNYSNLA